MPQTKEGAGEKQRDKKVKSLHNDAASCANITDLFSTIMLWPTQSAIKDKEEKSFDCFFVCSFLIILHLNYQYL